MGQLQLNLLSGKKVQESRARQLGKDRLGRQGAAKAQKQVKGSRKQTCSQPRAKEK